MDWINYIGFLVDASNYRIIIGGILVNRKGVETAAYVYAKWRARTTISNWCRVRTIGRWYYRARWKRGILGFTTKKF
ncbi:hypothetical protein [Priestia abyssalis]|uniref:hypothetical protein n=1 Tax=Priestia abyssalis TaxID=1221450 RepID=UPI001F24FDDB|nr:hypothetical protein [Priestia abyssalis]